MKKERIEWIDIAKGLAIMVVVIGHTVPFESFARNVIFSFHMPLFFILSGMTFRIAENRKEFLNRLKKDSKRLLFPLFILISIQYAIEFAVNGRYMWHDAIDLARIFVKRIFWSSAVSVNGDASLCLGMLWFLVSLFTARQLLNLLNIVFKNYDHLAMAVLLGAAGMFLGARGIMLPFNIDVSLLAAAFLLIGVFARDHKQIISQYRYVMMLVSAVIWSTCLYFDLYIEMGSRHYPYYGLSICEAVSGSFLVCVISNDIVKNKLVNIVIGKLGRISMWIYGIHSLDYYFLHPMIANGYPHIILIRLSVDVGIAFVLYSGYDFIRSGLSDKRGLAK